MADLLIRSMEMPKGQYKRITIYTNGDVEFYSGPSQITVLKGAAVELPDHGDLIDRAELLRSTPDVAQDDAWYGYAEGYSEDAIMNVRPIIPASKEGA